MSDKRNRAVAVRRVFRALDEVDAAAKDLQQHLAGYRTEIARARGFFEAGGTVPELLTSHPVTVWTTTISDARTVCRFIHQWMTTENLPTQTNCPLSSRCPPK